MIRVIDCIDEIVEKCFGDREVKELLEFTINNNKVSVKDQFLFHYENACYPGDKESLIRAILYKTHLQEDILLKLADYKQNLSRILELGEYSEVKLSYKEHLGTETTIGGSITTSSNDNKQVDNYAGYDRNTNINITDNRTGASETNRVEELKTVIPQPTMAQANNVELPKYEIVNRQLNVGSNQHNTNELNTPQYEESAKKIGYQNLTKDLTTNQSLDSNITNTSRASTSVNDGKHKTGRTDVRGNKSDTHHKSVSFITNDARVRL